MPSCVLNLISALSSLEFQLKSQQCAKLRSDSSSFHSSTLLLHDNYWLSCVQRYSSGEILRFKGNLTEISTTVCSTCVLLDAREGLLERVGCGGALGGVRWQAVGVHRLYRMTVGLVRDSAESVNNRSHDARHGRGQISWRRAQACSETDTEITDLRPASCPYWTSQAGITLNYWRFNDIVLLQLSSPHRFYIPIDSTSECADSWYRFSTLWM